MGRRRRGRRVERDSELGRKRGAGEGPGRIVVGMVTGRSGPWVSARCADAGESLPVTVGEGRRLTGDPSLLDSATALLINPQGAKLLCNKVWYLV